MCNRSTEIFEKFSQRKHKDQESGLIEPWMDKWYWKEIAPKYGVGDSFAGAIDLVSWYIGQSVAREYKNIIPWSCIGEFVEKSMALDAKIFSHQIFSMYRGEIAGIDFLNYAIYNAQDYLFCKYMSLLTGVDPETIVDFGSGSGRQANLWSQDPSAKTLISIEGVAQSYCMQSLYYELLQDNYCEYFDVKDGFFRVLRGFDGLKINHIPSWRTDLIRDDSVDLVVSVQVLGELRPEMTEYILKTFQRILKKGGVLYVRDHGGVHNPNNVDIDSKINACGFKSEYAPSLIDFKQIHGIPKFWKKI